MLLLTCSTRSFESYRWFATGMRLGLHRDLRPPTAAAQVSVVGDRDLGTHIMRLVAIVR